MEFEMSPEDKARLKAFLPFLWMLVRADIISLEDVHNFCDRARENPEELRLLATFLRAGASKQNPGNHSHELREYAKISRIMRNDFVSPAAIQLATGVAYSSGDWDMIHGNMPSLDVVTTLHGAGFCLVPCPPNIFAAMSRISVPKDKEIPEVRLRVQDLGSKDEKVRTRLLPWFALQVRPDSQSVGRDAQTQLAILTNFSKEMRHPLSVPDLGVVLWVRFLSRLLGQPLIRDGWLRVRDSRVGSGPLSPGIDALNVKVGLFKDELPKVGICEPKGYAELSLAVMAVL